MPNHPSAVLAFAALTAIMNKDREGYEAVMAQFEGGPTEALGAMFRIAESLVKMIAETQGVTPNQMLVMLGTGLAVYDEGLEPQ